jgi:hypothetical protein
MKRNNQGLSRTPEYHAWANMLSRCRATNKNHKHYAERGIKVCDRWKNSFLSFLHDVGKRPSQLHTLDRFPDNNGDYQPGNVRWATMAEQTRNTRQNVLIEINGRKRILTDWCSEFGIDIATVKSRVYRGMSYQQALTTPVRKMRSRILVRLNGNLTTLREAEKRTGIKWETLYRRVRFKTPLEKLFSKVRLNNCRLPTPLHLKKADEDGTIVALALMKDREVP